MSEFFYNPEKVGLFSIEQRVRMVKGALAHLENVEIVTSTQELVCDSGAQSWGHHRWSGACASAQDLVYEANMDYFNHQLAPELETVYLYAQPPYQAISSTRIRELLAFQQDISPYVPKSVMEEIKDDTSE